MKRSKLVGTIAVAAGVIAVSLIAGTPPPPAPLSPQSYQSDGTRALVETMQALGSPVTVLAGGVPRGQPAYSLVLSDSDIAPAGQLSATQRQGIARWANGGGHLVVADPLSPLANLRSASDLDGPDIFTNGQLGQGDNAEIAARLLGAGSGDPVYLVFPSPAPAGARSLTGLLDTRTRTVLGGFLLALVLWAVSRARRLGEPLAETPLVAVEGSALVESMGRLMMRSGVTLPGHPARHTPPSPRGG